MLAISKASLKPSSEALPRYFLVLGFPFIFILIFGFIGDNGGVPVYKIALDKNCDTTNALYESIKTSDRIKIVRFENDRELRDNLVKGKITGIFNIKKNSTGLPLAYIYTLSTTSASNDKWPQFMPVVNSIVNKISDENYKNRPTYAIPDFKPERDVEVIREYKTIDFILPGQLGFSLLNSGVFGVAFVFFNLRNTLVLKRFFATPISRTYIVLGEGLARVIFQMLTAIVIIVAGRFLFGFTLINGIETLLEMLVLSFLGLLVFMGLGFIVSGLARVIAVFPRSLICLHCPSFYWEEHFFR